MQKGPTSVLTGRQHRRPPLSMGRAREPRQSTAPAPQRARSGDRRSDLSSASRAALPPPGWPDVGHSLLLSPSEALPSALLAGNPEPRTPPNDVIPGRCIWFPPGDSCPAARAVCAEYPRARTRTQRLALSPPVDGVASQGRPSTTPHPFRNLAPQRAWNAPHAARESRPANSDR